MRVKQKHLIYVGGVREGLNVEVTLKLGILGRTGIDQSKTTVPVCLYVHGGRWGTSKKHWQVLGTEESPVWGATPSKTQAYARILWSIYKGN